TQAQIQHASPVMNANYLKSLQLANMKKQQGPTPANNSPMGMKRTDSTTSQSRPIAFHPNNSSINNHSYTSPKTNIVAQQQIQARAIPAQNTLNTTPSYAPILQQQIQDMNIPPLTPPGSFTSSNSELVLMCLFFEVCFKGPNSDLEKVVYCCSLQMNVGYLAFEVCALLEPFQFEKDQKKALFISGGVDFGLSADTLVVGFAFVFNCY
ncbi:MAG: hypothetical protein EZS28_050575, partial [Streblomastix strix]